MLNIKVALTNLGRYNEGWLIYVWLTLPASEDEIKQAMKDIGIGSKRWDGGVYEEYFITDYEAPFRIGEYENLSKLNDVLTDLDSANLLEPILKVKEGYDVYNLINLASEAGYEDIVADIISEDRLNEMTEYEASKGWASCKFFLSGIHDIACEFFYINGYGNIENFTNDYYETKASELIKAILSDYGLDA